MEEGRRTMEKVSLLDITLIPARDWLSIGRTDPQTALATLRRRTVDPVENGAGPGLGQLRKTRRCGPRPGRRHRPTVHPGAEPDPDPQRPGATDRGQHHHRRRPRLQHRQLRLPPHDRRLSRAQHDPHVRADFCPRVAAVRGLHPPPRAGIWPWCCRGVCGFSSRPGKR